MDLNQNPQSNQPGQSPSGGLPTSQAQVPHQPQPSPESFEPQPPPPTPPPVTPPPPQPEEVKPPGKSSKIILYTLVIIVVVVTIAALVMIFQSFTKTSQESSKETEIQVELPQPTITFASEDKDTEVLSEQGSSDEVADIEKDLQNTDFSNLDREIGSISSELSQ